MAVFSYFSELNAPTPSQISAARAALIDEIYSGATLPASGATSVTSDITDPLAIYGRSPSNLARCDELSFEIRDNSSNLLDTTVGYVWYPTSPNGKGIVNVGGHSPIPALYGFLEGRALIITEAVEAGYTVVGLEMPYDADVPTHNALPDPTASLNHLRSFVEPSIRALNEVASVSSWGINGLSGGGWTATIVPAVDARFNAAHCHAGMHPRFITRDTDWEQLLPGLYPDWDYPDLIMLATYGGKKYLQSHATEDDCCFTLSEYLQRPYASRMKYLIARAGGNYEMKMITLTNHEWPAVMRNASLSMFAEFL